MNVMNKFDKCDKYAKYAEFLIFNRHCIRYNPFDPGSLTQRYRLGVLSDPDLLVPVITLRLFNLLTLFNLKRQNNKIQQDTNARQSIRTQNILVINRTSNLQRVEHNIIHIFTQLDPHLAAILHQSVQILVESLVRIVKFERNVVKVVAPHVKGGSVKMSRKWLKWLKKVKI